MVPRVGIFAKYYEVGGAMERVNGHYKNENKVLLFFSFRWLACAKKKTVGRADQIRVYNDVYDCCKLLLNLSFDRSTANRKRRTFTGGGGG